MTLTLEAVVPEPALRPGPPASAKDTHIALYGDLTCPWSYLASRRAGLLETAGVDVDWWMVEHDRPTPGERPHQEARSEATRRDLARVSRRLLLGERLPHTPVGFVPYTRPAVSGYAEACLSGVGRLARTLLFDAFWVHAVDLGDTRLVRSLLAETVRSGHARGELLSAWGYAVDVTGAPVTTEAWRLVRRWRDGWSSCGEVVPLLVLDGDRHLSGVEAVEWLGSEVVRRGIDPALADRPVTTPACRTRDLADLPWATQNGGRWMSARREASGPDLGGRLRPWI